MADAHKNFAISTVATAPSPATSGTSLVVAAGQGTRFPAAPFNCTVWPAGSNPDPSNAEVVRVTAVSTDTFTITRAQEGSTARSIVVGDQIALTITAKVLEDVENNVSAVSSLVAAETSNRISAVAAATSNRISADNALSTAISSLNSAHNVLSNLVSDALSAGNVTSGQIANLFSADSVLAAAINTVSAALSNELSVRAAAVSNLTSADAALSAAVNVVSTALSNEVSVRAAAVSNLLSADGALSVAVNAVSTALSNELSVRAAAVSNLISADGVLAAAIDVVSTAVSNEVSVRAAAVSNLLSADVALSTAINTVSTALSNEASVRAAAISDEASVRSAADAALSVRIDGAGGGGGTPDIVRFVATAQTISATALTDVTALSVTVSAGGMYQMFGCIFHTQQVARNGVGVGLTFPAMTRAGGRLFGAVSIGGSAFESATVTRGQWFDADGSGSIIFSALPGGTNTSAKVVSIDASFLVSATGDVNIQARTSATANGIIIQPGSYIRLVRIN